MFAMYSKSTGLISSTINKVPANPEQIAALETAGYAFTEVADDVNGSNAVIDVASGEAIKFNAAPPPVPNIMVQYIAAQIGAGMLSKDAFHPVTVVEMDAMLSAAGMNTVTAMGAKNSVG